MSPDEVSSESHLDRTSIRSWLIRIVSVLIMVILLVGISWVVNYVWSDAADPSATPLNRINGLSTIAVALVSICTAAFALSSTINAQRALINASRPVLFPHFAQVHNTLFLMIINSGNGHAIDVTLQTDPAIRAYVGNPLASHFRWRDPIPFIPAGGEVPVDIFGREVQKILDNPGHQILTVRLRYRHSSMRKDYDETFRLNLDHYEYFRWVGKDGASVKFGLQLHSRGIPTPPPMD